MFIDYIYKFKRNNDSTMTQYVQLREFIVLRSVNLYNVKYDIVVPDN